MSEHEVARASTTEGLPVAPTMGPALAAAQVPKRTTLVDARVVWVSAVAVVVAAIATIGSRILIALIALVTNVAFYGRVSAMPVNPWDHALGAWVIIVPALGGLIVGVLARYGSSAIRGHGIPEAMEQVLQNESRIAPRLTFLKPLSAAIAIGTGGPFGAEGPIIATGGALGSVAGQLLDVTNSERKTLLAAGAAAGMAATFGTPISAVLLAVELLLFELRARSLVPVALASATAAGMRIALVGSAPMFPMPVIAPPGGLALVTYTLEGALVGLAAVAVTRAVYAVEDAFDALPVHWMWWPAIGGLAVGIVGLIAPRTLGVGYENITDTVSGSFTITALAVLCVLKLVSWLVALGSGTSGGTLAPLFTIGGGLGAVLGAGAAAVLPHAGVDVRVAALVGMAAIFAGASRAMLASVVFAFETTLQPLGLVPLLAGCGAAYLVSCLTMRNTIMTEKIARRGVRVPAEYAADLLEQVIVRDAAAKAVVTLRADMTLADARAWLESNAPGAEHQGFPVIDDRGVLIGVLTRRDLLARDASRPATATLADAITRPPVVVYDDCSLREATDHMVAHDIGRLPVIARADPRKLVGILTRSDVLAANRQRLLDARITGRVLRMRRRRRVTH